MKKYAQQFKRLNVTFLASIFRNCKTENLDILKNCPLLNVHNPSMKVF